MSESKSKPNVITMTRSQAAWFVDLALSSAGRDDITPVICGALVTVADGRVKVTSTDRYRVTLATLSVESVTGDHEFIIPRAALEWLAKNAGALGRYMIDYQRVTIATDDAGGLVLTVIDGQTLENRNTLAYSGHVTKGKFPPVERLVEKAREAKAVAAEATLNLDMLVAVRKLAPRGQAPTVKFTESDNPNRPGPVYFTFWGNGAIAAEVLVQPNLTQR